MTPAPEGLYAVIARQSKMPVDVVEAWVEANDREWALHNMKVLHQCGLTPAEGRVLHDHLTAEARLHIARLVDAGRMASLNVENLHWWAASGLLKPATTSTGTSPRGRRRPPKVSFTRWVTEARGYITAAGGDQRRAAMAAAAGLSADEVRSPDLTEDSLRMLIALNSGVRLPS